MYTSPRSIFSAGMIRGAPLQQLYDVMATDVPVHPVNYELIADKQNSNKL